VVFLEEQTSLQVWASIRAGWGRTRLIRLTANPEILAVAEFLDAKGNSLKTANWGRVVTGDELEGLWIRTADIPVMAPWQVPTQWGDLLACSQQLSAGLQWCVAQATSPTPAVLLVGFPIPTLIGGPSSSMHWQALVMPPPALKPKGFRQGGSGQWKHYRSVVLGKESRVNWCRTENWASGILSSRGQLPEGLRDASVLLLGAGALGSCVSEMLVRGGVTGITILDRDDLAAGNLLRHTLTLGELGQPKALALANHLNKCTATARVEGISESFPPESEDGIRAATECDLVVDCTAEYDTTIAMESFEWGGAKTFACLSFGFAARRLYCYLSRGISFPRLRFLELYGPWEQQEKSDMQATGCPMEGIGCWHPVFPARWDEVTLAASLAISDLVSFVSDASASERFTVYERGTDDGEIAVRRVQDV
jgi:hypothetical protein